MHIRELGKRQRAVCLGWSVSVYINFGEEIIKSLMPLLTVFAFLLLHHLLRRLRLPHSLFSPNFKAVPSKNSIFLCTYGLSAAHLYSCIIQVCIKGSFSNVFKLPLFDPSYFFFASVISNRPPTHSISAPRVLFFRLLFLIFSYILLSFFHARATHTIFPISLSVRALTMNMVLMYSRRNLSIY